ncbi:MAG: hypothetical protein AAGM16_03255 [Pseudomonadota bacterium]
MADDQHGVERFPEPLGFLDLEKQIAWTSDVLFAWHRDYRFPRGRRDRQHRDWLAHTAAHAVEDAGKELSGTEEGVFCSVLRIALKCTQAGEPMGVRDLARKAIRQRGEKGR